MAGAIHPVAWFASKLAPTVEFHNRQAFTMHIRPTLARDVSLLPAVERSAAQAFRQLPSLAWLADSEVMTEADHLAFAIAGTSWVAVDAHDHPAGFLCATVAADALHINELSVSHQAQGQGLGRRLLDQATQAARQRGLAWLTLTTFADVPWNAPFYQRYGFISQPVANLDPRLLAVLAEERAHGLENRCAMRLSLTL